MKVAGVLKRIFDWRVHGIRGVNVIGLVLVSAMVFSVYLAKADAAGESALISDLERDIRANGQRVRLLRAEVARLENPERLEALSRQAGLEPMDARRAADEAALSALEPGAGPAAPPAAPSAEVRPEDMAEEAARVAAAGEAAEGER